MSDGIGTKKGRSTGTRINKILMIRLLFCKSSEELMRKEIFLYIRERKEKFALMEIGEE